MFYFASKYQTLVDLNDLEMSYYLLSISHTYSTVTPLT